MIPAKEALQKLREGNKRFVTGSQVNGGVNHTGMQPQEPFAVILGCADSRVPAELVFDQGLGDLFVIRVAGNVVNPALIGSVEFAAAKLGTRLVVVMGHSHCGAVQATINELKQPSEGGSPNLGAIVDFIRPSVEPLMHEEAAIGADALCEQAVRANVRSSVDKLHEQSTILEELAGSDGLVIVGAEYDLHSGEVEFFHGLPDGD